MERWLRFSHDNRIGFGRLVEDRIEVRHGDLFAATQATGQSIPLAQATLLTPCVPGKFLGLWNNFGQRAAAEGWTQPAHPLYFAKPVTCHLPHGGLIRRPAGYDGMIVFEGELGIVVGRRCHNAGEDEAREAIFGYTCVNDVTAFDLIQRDPTFAQWTRAKGFDSFGAFGPVICRGIDPAGLFVRTLVDGVEKQNYPVADMFFAPHQIVSRISRDTTLEPGDLIACGTSIGAGGLSSGSLVEVEIQGIGRLANRMAAD